MCGADSHTHRDVYMREKCIPLPPGSIEPAVLAVQLVIVAAAVGLLLIPAWICYRRRRILRSRAAGMRSEIPIADERPTLSRRAQTAPAKKTTSTSAETYVVNDAL